MLPSLAFLGPEGTYTHQAAYEKFGDKVQYLSKRTISDVYRALCGECKLGIIPQENSIFGAVIETYDLLRRSDAGRDIFVRDEITLNVQHCLLVKKGTNLKDVTRVLSHEQALGQCSRFIEQHLRNATLVKTPSTAAAVDAVSSSVSGTSAAIASKLSVQLFDGIELLYEGIQDENTNFTRFYVIANSRTTELPSSSTIETSVSRGIFRIYCPTSSTKKLQITRIFDILQLQVTRIDRRPRIGAKSFDDIYFVEVEDDEIRDSSIKCSGNCTPNSWTNRLDLAKARIDGAGGEAMILGSWPC